MLCLTTVSRLSRPIVVIVMLVEQDIFFSQLASVILMLVETKILC